jgi:WD40 repeat protein/serine/threonine protein kinase
MPITQTCSKCGSEFLTTNALGGLCAKCVARVALGAADDIDFEPAQSVSPPPSEKLGELIGRYRLLKKIGEGGCGVVYLAEQEQPVRRQLALKIIKLGMDTKEVILRFEAERQALALMDHPNIARVLDAGATDTGRPYFVMELVKGIPITKYCDQKNLTTMDRLRLFVRVCQAIQHAHQKGVIHRDIKPSNVLVTEHDDKPEPKIIDFGIAKATTDQQLTDRTLFTAFEQFLGTPAYMSPEQASMSGANIDTRSDIYSLGVLLYELLTGKIPFEAKRLLKGGLEEIRRIIREEEPMRPSTRVHSLDPVDGEAVARQRQSDAPKLGHLLKGDLDWIVMKALEKDRERRYETANGLAKDVQRHLENEPVIARPPGQFYRFQKMIRRNRLLFGAVASVGISLILGLATSSFLFVRERKARLNEAAMHRQEETAKQQAQREARRAEEATLETRIALSASDFLQGCRLQSEGRPSDALGYFTRSLSASPSNNAALTTITTILEYQRWVVPVMTLKSAHVAQFSPDGQRVVTVARDGTSRLWDSQTGRPLTEPPQLGTNLRSAQFSPDGKRILTVSQDGILRLWDAQMGTSQTDPRQFATNIRSAQFSPDGKHILTTFMGQTHLSVLENHDAPSGVTWSQEIAGYSYDGTMKLWETDSGQPVAKSSEQSGFVEFAVFDPDGTKIITASPDGATKLWNAQNLQPLERPLAYTNVDSAQFSSDGKRIVTVARDGAATVWDVPSGRPLRKPLKTTGSVVSARFDAPVRQVITGSSDGTVQIWEVEGGRPLTEPFKHGPWVNSAQFSPDGKRILTASSDDTAIIWELVSGPAGTEVLKHDGEVNSAQFSPDSRRVVTASADKTARIWDVRSGKPLTEALRHESIVFSAEFSPDGQKIATACQDQPAQIWDAQSGRRLATALSDQVRVAPAIQQQPTQPPIGLRIVNSSGEPPSEPAKPSGPLKTAHFSSDGTRVLTVSRGLQTWESTTRVWDAQNGRPLTDALTHDAIVTAAQFSPDGKRVVTASYDGTIQIWDAQIGRLLTKPWKHDKGIVAAQFSPDGTRILTAAGDKTVRLWDAQNGQPVGGPLSHTSDLTSAQFSPDGKRIVTTCDDGTARIWDAQNGQPATEPLQHGTNVNCAEFSPDGRWIVTVARNGATRVWDARTGQPLTESWYQDGVVHSGRFSPDGKRVITASSDGTARIWDIAPASGTWPQWLLRLAEAIGGKVLNQQGVLEPTPLNRSETITQIRAELDRSQDHNDWTDWGRWFLGDPETRTISPFSTISAHEENQDVRK